MNMLVMENIGKLPGKDGKVFLNGEDVSNDCFKVEIGVTEILLHRYERPSKVASDGNTLVSYTTVIDELKVN